MPYFTISTERFLTEVKNAIHSIRGSDTEEVIQVWYCKTVQNHKGLFITDAFDGHFYECTYNGDKMEMYVDDYVKAQNWTVYIILEREDV